MGELVRNFSKISRRIIKKITMNHYTKINMKRFKPENYSLITSNCIGGIINNRLGQPQNSPTFNLWIPQANFIKFVKNLHYYMEQELSFVESPYHYPAAMLDDIPIYFTHYSSEDEARSGWERRKKRIVWDNIYIIMYEDEVTREDLLQLYDVECKKLIVLTGSKENLDLPFMKYIEKDKHGRENDYVFLDSDFTGKMTFEKQWDYVGWLNN